MTKKELRAQIAAKVASLSPDYCQTADAAICQHIRSWDSYQKAQTIFCYIGIAREINTTPLLEAMLADGKRLALPLCIGKGIMEAREIKSLEDLVPGKFDIPAPALHCPVVEPEAFDLAFVPCSTGNARGQRLGYGGGFYDRYLPRMNCSLALLCRGELLEEEIPMEPHDTLMDYLVTETGIFPCK